MGVLLIRELNVDGCGDFADVLVQTDQPFLDLNLSFSCHIRNFVN